MAKTKTVEYTLSLDDLATSVYDKFVKAVESGEVDITKAIQGTSGAYDAHGKAINGVTKWIREQRTEQRQQNFLFREAQSAVAAAGLALSLFSTSSEGASPRVKKVSDSLNAGIVAFQGLGAVAAFLPGPIGMAVQAVGAVTVGLMRFSDTSEEAKQKIKDQKEEIDKLAKAYDDWTARLSGTSKANEAISKAEADLLREKIGILRQVIDQQKSGAKEIQVVINDIGKTPAQLAAIQTQAIDATGKTIKENEAALSDLEIRFKSVTQAANTIIVNGTEPLSTSLKGLRKNLQDVRDEMEKVPAGGDQYSKLRVQAERLQATIKDLETPPKSLWLFNFGIELDKSFTQGRQAVRDFKDSMKSLFGDGSSEEVRIQLRIEADLTSMQQSLMTETQLIDEWEASVVDSQTATEEQKTRGTQIASKRRQQIELQNTQKTFQQVGDIAARSVNLLGKFAAQASEARLIDIQNEKDAALAAIDKKLEAENLTEDQKKALLAERAAVEEKYTQKEKEAKTQAFEAQKTASVIESIINTAVAVTRGLPNIPLAIAIGILGAAETALIAGQPTPRFHSGTKGPVYFDAPPSREFPILVRGGETFDVRTESQQRSFQQSAGSSPIIINIYGPIADELAFKRIVEKGMRSLGATDVNKYFRSTRTGVTVG